MHACVLKSFYNNNFFPVCVYCSLFSCCYVDTQTESQSVSKLIVLCSSVVQIAVTPLVLHILGISDNNKMSATIYNLTTLQCHKAAIAFDGTGNCLNFAVLFAYVICLFLIYCYFAIVVFLYICHTRTCIEINLNCGGSILVDK